MSECNNLRAVDCLLARPLTQRETAARQRDYMSAIQPMIKMKTDVYAFGIPVIIIEPGGSMRSEYRFDDSQKAVLEAADSMIEMTKKVYFS